MRRLKFRLRVERSWSRLTCFNDHFFCVCVVIVFDRNLSLMRCSLTISLALGGGPGPGRLYDEFVLEKNRSALLFQSLQMCVCWMFEINELHFMLSFLAAFFPIFVRLIAALQMAAIKKNVQLLFQRRNVIHRFFLSCQVFRKPERSSFVVYFPRRLPIYYTCTE